MSEIRYLQPGWFTQHVFNRLVRRLTLLGISVAGSRELRVRGRSSGEWRATPVNPVDVDGIRYLVAPRGVTQWVRNIRVAGGGELRVGRRSEAITVSELPDDEKLPVLREYMRRWAWEVGTFFGLGKDATDEQLLGIAGGFPVFRIG
jgi:deazaflavin-dependent oxidoreductase (nitroreductase family)